MKRTEIEDQGDAVPSRFNATHLLCAFWNLATHRFQQLYWRRRITLHESAKVSLRARIVHGAGISIGSRVRVFSGAVLDCSESPFAYRPNRASTRWGRIIIDERSSIRPYACLYSYAGRITIGKRCTVNPFTVIYGHGGVAIGNDVHIATHSTVVSANHIYANPDMLISVQGESRAGIEIQDGVWIGAGARILDGVKIGRGSVIAAGAVVTGDVDPMTVVGGVPARVLKKRSPVVQ